VNADLWIPLKDVEKPVLGLLDVFSCRLGEIVLGNLLDNIVE
jgi:hypothetical protein